ncbi:MAG: hypothetical protein IPK03_12890 [Bacteroidetes bacterium]|nr:hypothetical protein [Bacteroidota bacterium]
MNRFARAIFILFAIIFSACNQEPANETQVEEGPVVKNELPIETNVEPFQALPIKEVDTVCFEEVFFSGKEKNTFFVKFYLQGNYNYFLDGGTKSQLVEFRLYDQFAVQKTGELEEKNGIQFLNPATAKYTDTFTRVFCNIKPINI